MKKKISFFVILTGMVLLYQLASSLVVAAAVVIPTVQLVVDQRIMFLLAMLKLSHQVVPITITLKTIFIHYPLHQQLAKPNY